MAQCLERLQRPWEAVRSAYLDCIAQHPGRAEPLVHLAELERRRGHYSVAYGLAARAAGVPMPGRDALFVQRQAYEFRALDEKAIAAFYLGRYQESFDINAGLLQAASLPEGERKRIEVNRDHCVPYLAEIRLARDDTRIESLGRAGAESGEVTLTITSSKRPELFVKTVNSFVNCCTDVERIGRWICVDDNSSAEDRREMQRLFPFFEFIWKGPEQKGHARSMNLILDAVTTPYWLHLEDDWQFFEALPYVTLALEILEEDRGLGQVLFNRHYAESLEDRGLPGGVIRRTATGRRFLEHLHLAPGTPEYDEFVCAHAGSLSNVYWPHYSLRPALLRMSAIRAVGPYDEDSTHFELEFANRYQQRGFRSAFLDTICSLHIGRRTTERSSAAEPNAYELNEEPQFDEPPIRVQLLANWCSSEDVCREWERMSQGGGRWGRIQVTASPDDIDYHAVINAPPPGAQIAPERTIVFHMAPVEGIERLPGEWSAPDPAKFFQIRDHQHFPNVSQWHLGKTWRELHREAIEKSRMLSTVTSSLYSSPGHRKRVDFIHYLQANGIDIDAFGKTNERLFKYYRGALPRLQKEAGLFPYRYTFAAENHAERNYFTEKLVDAILSECLCFYWGCPNVSDYIDGRAFIALDLDDFEASAQTIRRAMETDEWSRRIDVIREEKRRILDHLQFFPTLERIVTGAFEARLRRARALQAEGQDAAVVTEAYELAFREDPTRAEPLWELAGLLDSPEDSFSTLARIKDLSLPSHCGESRDLYEWRILDAYAVEAMCTGRMSESFAACDELLRRDALPAEQRSRVMSNATLAAARLPLPETVVINLDRRPDRLAQFQQRSAAAGLGEVRRSPAVDGQALSWNPEIGRLFNGNDFDDRRAVIGCALSHLELWRQVHADTLILEDDVEFGEAFLVGLQSALRRARLTGDGWDVIFLGFSAWRQGGIAGGHPRLSAMPREEYLGGLFAYLLSARGAGKLVTTAEKDGIRCGIDRFIMSHVPDLAMYVMEPCIAFSQCARPGSPCDSDIQYDPEPIARDVGSKHGT